MRILGVIPVRMASTRLPGKPLKDISGSSLVHRVWEQASKVSSFTRLVIATDSQEIVEASQAFHAEVVMTPSSLATGTDRVAAVLKILESQGESFDLIANVQGDMPFIKPAVIQQAIDVLKTASGEYGMSTIATPITDQAEFDRPSSVKVALGVENRALYFSRAPIPYPRNASLTGTPLGLKHIGLYVFRPKVLHAMAEMKQTEPELREGLEQLRALCNGIQIKVAVIDRELMEPSIEVDTPEDLERANILAKSEVD